MRFRMGLGQQAGYGAQPAVQSFGHGLQSLFSLPLMEAQAADEAATSELKRSLMGAQTDQARAHAALFGQQAEDLRTTAQRGEMPELLKTAYYMNGGAPGQADEFVNYATTGRLPPGHALQPDGMGPTLPTPAYADPELARKIWQSLGLTQQALTIGDKSVENIAKATGAYQAQGLTGEAAALARSGADDMTMSRLNAVRGNKEFTPYKAVGTTGVALNEVTGQGSVADQGLRTLYGDVQGANILKDKAAASASYASADNSRALASLHRSQTGGSGTGDGGPNEAALDNDTVRFMARQYLKGDQSVLTNLGRGAQGAKNIVRLRNAIRLEAESAGMDPSQVASAVAMFQGDKAAFRAAGTRSANVEMAATEADQVADLALESSKTFGRTGFVPANKAIRAYQTNTGDPNVVAFGAANLALINTYARAISPSGTPTVHDKQHAEEMLSTAFSPEQYNAVVAQMKREIAAAKASPGAVRNSMAARIGTPAGAAHAPAAPSAADPLGIRR